MLSKYNFTREHIEKLHETSGNDPSILERTIYAFGLLEAIRRSGMPFIFKGGTALLLLLDKPTRLSTDIDIIVEPGVNVEAYIQEAGKIFPFLESEEDVRIGANKIEKRHYKFIYKSPLSGRIIYILLDILFEENPYHSVIERPIENLMLLTEGQPLMVRVPGINCILGDKLTAFAPHTTGVLLGVNKELTYRSMNLQPKDVLADTVRTCICLIGRGSINKDEYSLYIDGINRIRNHIFSGSLSGESVGIYACGILYLAASILSGKGTSQKHKTDFLRKTGRSYCICISD